MSKDNESDKKFWKNMGIMFIAKIVIVGVGIVLTVNYNSHFYI